MAKVAEVLIADSPSSQMRAVEVVRAVAARGLEGDRYFFGVGTFSPHPQRPDFEITFIEKECVEGFVKEVGLPFTAALARRNIVTEGIRLNDLVGRKFFVGEALIEGIRLCEPCNYLAKQSFAETLHGLVRKGGLRARILEGGMVRVGDLIRVFEA